jgi:cystathionine gamma-synthase
MNEPLAVSLETMAAQAMGEVDPLSGDLVPSIHMSTTYERQIDGSYHQDRVYTRADNPTFEHAERLLAALEGGCSCALFASGMAAATAIFQSLVPGDHVLVARVLYWGVRKWLAEFALTWGLDVEFIDTTDLADVERSIRPGRTRLIWIETPANPMWDITDLAAVATVAHAADVLVVVDNTVATPVLTRPIAYGADLVVHSATKYLNGHSDVLAGAVVTARRDAFWERIRSWRRNAGAVVGPFEAWLLQRGMRTLFLRMRRSSDTALLLARHFEGHPLLHAVLYPGLAGHPGHAIAARQMEGGFSGMLSIRVSGGEPAAMAVAAAVRVFKRATSLGGVESLVEHRRSTEGPSSPVPGDLLRLSIGLETPGDLVADLEAALQSLPRTAAISAPCAVHPPVPAVPAIEPDLSARVTGVLERGMLPAVIARGGTLRVVSVEEGVVTLEASGSPGAVVPLVERVEALLRSTFKEITGVRIPGMQTRGQQVDQPGELADRVRQVLDEDIGPAIATHHGRIVLEGLDAGRVRLRLEGGCQGCSLAAVTVRQGIEPLLRTRFPEIVGVTDVTDHAAGTEPFFSPEKR